MFVELFLKKRDQMPSKNLRKLVAAFDAIKDPVRVMKLISVKQGVEGAIALAQSHGEEVNWEKVDSLYACPLSEMMELFKKAMEYAPKLVSLILPVPTSSTTVRGSSTPSSSKPAVDASAPSSATDPATEVT
jgi:hypothetical protein